MLLFIAVEWRNSIAFNLVLISPVAALSCVLSLNLIFPFHSCLFVFLPLALSYVQYFQLLPIITLFHFPYNLSCTFPINPISSPSSLPHPFSPPISWTHLLHLLLTPPFIFFHSAAESHQAAMLSTKKTGTCLWSRSTSKI